MTVIRDVVTFIDTLPEAVMFTDRQGKFLDANSAFYELTGIVRDALLGQRLYKLPFVTRNIKRGMIRLFVKASRGGDSGTYSFPHVLSGGEVVNITAEAHKVVFESQECIVFNLKWFNNGAGQLDDPDSWKYCMELSYEPYLEFRPSALISSVNSQENHLEFLSMLGESLRVKFYNDAASEFYEGKKNSLEGKTFLSFFTKESDAIGFLDMLSVVGQIKGDTNVNTNKASGVHVKMDCLVKFDDNGNIAALYCSQRDMSGAERYKAIIGVGRQEMDFMYNQPFVGFAFLVPPRPLERPPLENLYDSLDDMLDQIVVVRANQTMFSIHGSDKAKFLMKPMRWFFNDALTARQALKELFVMRETSSGWRNQYGDDFDLVSVFRAMFDNSDRLSGVLVVTSKYSSGYHPRHTYARQKAEQRPEGENLVQPLLRHTYDPTYDPFSFLK